MDAAGERIARSIARFFPAAGHCVVFAGKGNNAGDAFVAAAWLARAGWEIELRLAFPEAELNELARKKLHTLRAVSAPPTATHLVRPSCVLLDGLLGLGAHAPLRDPVRAATRELNALRADGSAFTFAIDLPTGLDSDSGAAVDDCVVADFTVTIGFAKRGLMADGAADFVGRLVVISLPQLSAPAVSDAGQIASADTLRHLLPRRRFESHKNQFGRIGIVGGSKGFTGAALLCSAGALRAGAGLVELFVPEEIYPIIAAAARPEVMVKPIVSYAALAQEPVDVWAIGPGLGQAHAADVLDLIAGAEQPMVVDADALNILSHHLERLASCRGPRLLTPHPGEMKRLMPDAPNSRAETVTSFCARYPVTLLLKGSRTVVGERGKPLSYNTTGDPGMATGGMGDVLTGVCAGLLGQKLAPYDAARLGAWLCGRAAELAIFDGSASEQSLLPSDILDHLGAAALTRAAD